MKIVYISSPFFLDADVPLIKTLISKGHIIHFFIKMMPNALKSPLLDIPEIYPKAGVFDSSIYDNHIDKYKKYIGIEKIYIINSLTNSLNLKESFFLNNQFHCYLEKIDPDIIHLISWPSITAFRWIFKYRKKIVCTIHDPYPHEGARSLKLRVLNILSKLFLKNYILLNKTQTKAFRQYYLIFFANIYYSNLGNYDLLDLFGEKKENGKRYILFFGRITPYKGVDVLLAAFRKVQSEFKDINLIVAGSGEFNFDITPYLHDSQIDILNRFIQLEELGTLIKNCEFVVCPYISATQSGVVASVLALGKPLIVTRVGGLPDMIVDGKSGLVIMPNSVDALADSLRTLLHDRDKVEKMVQYIKETSENGEKSWNKIANELIKTYYIINNNI